MTIIERAEVLAVGTELLLGEIHDTNSAFLAAELAARSVDVYWTQRVGDNRGRIAEGVRSALGRSDLVLLSGGLGPTDDDLTREAIADVLGEEPAVDDGLAAALRARFARTGRAMPEGNLKQAWLVPSAEALPNPHGTAPGWFVRVGDGGRERLVVALPGPPREMVPMWREQVVPRLRLPAGGFVATTLKTHGIGESHVAERLGELTRAANPSVATYARRDGVHVRVAAKAAGSGAARALLEPVVARVRERLAPHVWGADDDDLASLTLRHLRLEGRGLAVVDAGTGGALVDLLGSVEAPPDASGACRPLEMAVVACADEAMAVLGVPGSAHAAGAPDGAATALAIRLAEHSRARCAADYGVAVAPFGAVAADDEPGRPVWESAWAVAGPSGTHAQPFRSVDPAHATRRERLAFATLVGLWTQLITT